MKSESYTTLSMVLAAVLAAAFMVGLSGSAFAQPSGGGQAADELSRQATHPTASLMALNFLNELDTSYHGLDDTGYLFLFRPVVPFRAWGASNILRMTVPYQGSGPGDAGLKDVTLFDLVVFPRSWGRFGLGPVMNLAESAGDAPSKFAIGPAVGAVLAKSKKLNLGAFSQNLFAGDVAVSQIQPVVAYQLGRGFALSAGDLQFTYDWKRQEWVSIPFGFQIGVVRRVAGQPFRFSLNPQWNFADLSGSVKSQIVFTVTLLVPSG